MNIKIKLFGPFRIDRFKEELRVCASGTSVDEIVSQLHLPRQLLGIVLINGRHAEIADTLSDGDELMLLPLLGGG